VRKAARSKHKQSKCIKNYCTLLPAYRGNSEEREDREKRENLTYNLEKCLYLMG